MLEKVTDSLLDKVEADVKKIQKETTRVNGRIDKIKKQDLFTSPQGKLIKKEMDKIKAKI